MNPFLLKQKTILVTGASSGIGKQIAISASQMGATIIITGRNKLRLTETFKMLDTSYEQQHLLSAFDLNDTHELEKFVAGIPAIHGLVHSAGITSVVPFKLIKKETLKQVLQSNVEAPFILTQELIKSKKINNASSIIFISSIAGNIIGSIAQSAYATSKAALNGLSKSLAVELASSQIRVNSVLPAMIETDMIESWKSKLSKEELDADINRYLMKRYGKPEDVANLCIFLLSDASNWITGVEIVIDGGLTVR